MKKYIFTMIAIAMIATVSVIAKESESTFPLAAWTQSVISWQPGKETAADSTSTKRKWHPAEKLTLEGTSLKRI